MLTISRSLALICSALLLISTTTSVLAAPAYDNGLRTRRACGTHISAARRTSAEKIFQSHRVPAREPGAHATIETYIYNFYANETVEGGYLSDEVIAAQFEVLNKGYAPVNVTFNLVNVTRVEHPEYFVKVAPEGPEEVEMKQAYRQGEANVLNIWTVGFKEGLGKGLLGYATFPSDYEQSPLMDGVVLLYSTMPNITDTPYNQGQTLTHEVGHWAGLYHTFEGGCEGKGDYIADTPAQRQPTFGCPTVAPVSCSGPRAEPDAISNFMNYSDDVCMVGFSPGQITRIQSQLRSFRQIEI